VVRSAHAQNQRAYLHTYAHTHRRAVVHWLFGECHDDVDENWELALQLSEEDDIMRCWMAEALCDTGKVFQARVLIEVQNSCLYLLYVP
jgi:hypothetical protein